MLPIIPLSSTPLTSRGEPSTASHRCASSRSPPRISLHSLAFTRDVFHASSHFASAKGLPPSVAQRFIRERPYRSCCACAAIVAPPCTDWEASSADRLSSDRRSPASPELRTKAPPPRFAPRTSSENRVKREGAMSLVCIVLGYGQGFGSGIRERRM